MQTAKFSAILSFLSSASANGAGAQYKLYQDKNVVVGTDKNNLADLVGCVATGSKDVRNLPAEKQKCLDECSKNSKCIGLTFHEHGTMLKKSVDGKPLSAMMVDRAGFETYVKPSAATCYSPVKSADNAWCVNTCGYALEHGFLAGHGDSTASGQCCWNDCKDQTYNNLPYHCFCDGSTDTEEGSSESHGKAANPQNHVTSPKSEDSNETSHSTSGAGAQYKLWNDKNVMVGSDDKNQADLVGCVATGNKDVRNLPAEKQKCLNECTKNSDCIGVTFHSQGTMLKKSVDGKALKDMMVDRAGFETYAKPSAATCYSPGKSADDAWCVSNCGYALEHGFLAGHGDSTASGQCCWNDCKDQVYNDLPYHCFCDGSIDTSQLLI